MNHPCLHVKGQIGDHKSYYTKESEVSLIVYSVSPLKIFGEDMHAIKGTLLTPTFRRGRRPPGEKCCGLRLKDWKCGLFWNKRNVPARTNTPLRIVFPPLLPIPFLLFFSSSLAFVYSFLPCGLLLARSSSRGLSPLGFSPLSLSPLGGTGVHKCNFTR